MNKLSDIIKQETLEAAEHRKKYSHDPVKIYKVVDLMQYGIATELGRYETLNRVRDYLYFNEENYN
jgi:hypothetical protein